MSASARSELATSERILRDREGWLSALAMPALRSLARAARLKEADRVGISRADLCARLMERSGDPRARVLCEAGRSTEPYAFPDMATALALKAALADVTDPVFLVVSRDQRPRWPIAEVVIAHLRFAGAIEELRDVLAPERAVIVIDTDTPRELKRTLDQLTRGTSTDESVAVRALLIPHPDSETHESMITPVVTVRDPADAEAAALVFARPNWRLSTALSTLYRFARPRVVPRAPEAESEARAILRASKDGMKGVWGDHNNMIATRRRATEEIRMREREERALTPDERAIRAYVAREREEEDRALRARAPRGWGEGASPTERERARARERARRWRAARSPGAPADPDEL